MSGLLGGPGGAVVERRVNLLSPQATAMRKRVTRATVFMVSLESDTSTIWLKNVFLFPQTSDNQLHQNSGEAFKSTLNL